MTERRCEIAIIGAGTAGLHAYKAARTAGADILIIERGLGGSTCTRSGCIPSKLLIAAGRAAASARRVSAFGIEFSEIEIDGSAILGRLRTERDKANEKIKLEYENIPADHRMHGDARFTGPTTLVVGDVAVRAQSVIVAVGGAPDIPPSLQPVCDLVHTNETIFEIEKLPASMAVIGGGPLGLELAQGFARLGVAVTVLDAADNVGALKDPECEKAARNALSHDFPIHSGVELRTSLANGKARIEWTGTTVGTLEVEMVLAATGRTPNLAALELAKAGITDNLTDVPEFDHITRRCGNSAVFIAGDAGGWRPLLHEAARGGTIAGATAAGGKPLPPVPALAIAFTEPNLVEVGTNFEDLPNDAIIGTALAVDNARSGIDAQDQGLVRLYADRTGQLLGASIVLTGGEHLGQALAVALFNKMDAALLVAQPWYHPCLEEMVQEAARDICGQIGGAKQ